MKTAALAEAQGGVCAYCPAVFTPDDAELDAPGIWPTFDHVIPKSKNGANGINNGLAACGPCNTAKGDRMPTKRELKKLAEIAPKALAIYARMTEDAAEERLNGSGARGLTRREHRAARKAQRRMDREEARDDFLWPRSYRAASREYVERESMALTGRTYVRYI